jgi:CRP-like cAMP-binding protein
MKEGEYFGEISLMTQLRRTATVKAKEFCTLGFLTKKVF